MDKTLPIDLLELILSFSKYNDIKDAKKRNKKFFNLIRNRVKNNNEYCDSPGCSMTMQLCSMCKYAECFECNKFEDQDERSNPFRCLDCRTTRCFWCEKRLNQDVNFGFCDECPDSNNVMF